MCVWERESETHHHQCSSSVSFRVEFQVPWSSHIKEWNSICGQRPLSLSLSSSSDPQHLLLKCYTSLYHSPVSWDVEIYLKASLIRQVNRTVSTRPGDRLIQQSPSSPDTSTKTSMKTKSSSEDGICQTYKDWNSIFLKNKLNTNKNDTR